MKKYLATLAVTALAVSAFAQGTVVLQNSTGLVKQWTSATDSTVMTTPQNGGMVQLIAAASGTALANPLGTLGTGGFAANYSTLAAFLAANPGWALTQTGIGSTAPVAAAANIGFGAGLFNAGTRYINGIPAGGAAQYMVVGWTGNAANYEAAYAADAFLGVSAVFNMTATGDPTAVPAGTAISLRPTFGGMTLAPLSVIPEPSTFALAGLGAAALLIFRRRK